MLLKTVALLCPTSHSSGSTVASNAKRTVNPPALKGQPTSGVIRRAHIDEPETEVCGHPAKPCQIPAGKENKTCQNQPKTKQFQKLVFLRSKNNTPPAIRIAMAEAVCRLKISILVCSLRAFLSKFTRNNMTKQMTNRPLKVLYLFRG